MRKPLSKKIRFEVFKRDNFTCQYCGRKAPDVILNVDHIHPVKEGGTNDILNLITSCFDCNSGKRHRKLSDNTVVEKQRQQIEELNERRIQLEMMLQWRDEVEKFETDKLQILVDRLSEKFSSKFYMSDSFKKELKTALKKYGLENMLEAIAISDNTYLKNPEDRENAELFLRKIPGIAYYNSLSPLESKIKMVVNFVHKAFPGIRKWQIENLIKNYTRVLADYWEYSDEQIITDLEKEVLSELNDAERYNHFENRIYQWTEDIKNNN